MDNHPRDFWQIDSKRSFVSLSLETASQELTKKSEVISWFHTYTLKTRKKRRFQQTDIYSNFDIKFVSKCISGENYHKTYHRILI